MKTCHFIIFSTMAILCIWHVSLCGQVLHEHWLTLTSTPAAARSQPPAGCRGPLPLCQLPRPVVPRNTAAAGQPAAVPPPSQPPPSQSAEVAKVALLGAVAAIALMIMKADANQQWSAAALALVPRSPFCHCAQGHAPLPGLLCAFAAFKALQSQ